MTSSSQSSTQLQKRIEKLWSTISLMTKCPRRPRIFQEYSVWRPRRRNPESIVARYRTRNWPEEQVVAHGYQGSQEDGEKPKCTFQSSQEKGETQDEGKALSHLKGSTGQPATGIIPNQERNIGETLRLSYLLGTVLGITYGLTRISNART